MTSFACSPPSLLGRPVADEDEDELLRRLDSDVSSTMSVTFCYAAVYLLSLAKMRRGQSRERERVEGRQMAAGSRSALLQRII